MKRVVVITGVAGGIGRATAEAFDDAGWHVIGVDRREFGQGDCVHTFIQADISDPDSAREIAAKAQDVSGRLHALVNNAAVQICKPLLETTEEEWQTVMDSNVRSVFLGARHAHPLLKAACGAIVNVSSVHAVATSAGVAAYATSKGALLALTRAMALEFGPDGIRVNAVLTGAVDTPMLHSGLARDHPEGATLQDLVRGIGLKHVIGRVGQPDEIGRAILFLADGEQSSFITGQALVVDGGATARLSTE